MITLMLKLMFWMIGAVFYIAGYMLIGMIWLAILACQLLWWCIRALYAAFTKNRIPSIKLARSSDYFGKVKGLGKMDSIKINRSTSNNDMLQPREIQTDLNNIGKGYESVINGLASEDDVVLAHFKFITGSGTKFNGKFAYRFVTDEDISIEELNILREMLYILNSDAQIEFNLIDPQLVELIVKA